MASKWNLTSKFCVEKSFLPLFFDFGKPFIANYCPNKLFKETIVENLFNILSF